MTGYGFTGPMTARGTVFDAKLEAEVVPSQATRYRYGYRANWSYALALLVALLLGGL